MASAGFGLPRYVTWHGANPFRRVLRTNGTVSLEGDFLHAASKIRNSAWRATIAHEIRL
jgi:hypothetical protein